MIGFTGKDLMARKSRKESVFLTELKNSQELLYPSAFWHKISDVPKVGGLRFIPEKPFDGFFLLPGVCICFEGKVHDKHTAWPINKVQDHQVKNLLKVAVNGHKGWILVNVRYGRGKARVNFCAVIEIDKFIEIINSGKKSLKVDELRVYKTINWIKYNGNRVWDLFSLF